MSETQEFSAFKLSGFLVLSIVLGLAAIGAWLCSSSSRIIEILGIIAIALCVPASLIALSGLSSLGFVTIQPNQARVLIFLGSYIGSISNDGFWWVNPLASKQMVSLRVRNFSSDRLKVNDARGNPIEIGAVIVWRVVDTAKATFD